MIKESVDLVRKANPNVKVLCGAGVNKAEDVSIALKLGTRGVLLASAVVKSADPEKAIREIAEGY